MWKSVMSLSVSIWEPRDKHLLTFMWIKALQCRGGRSWTLVWTHRTVLPVIMGNLQEESLIRGEKDHFSGTLALIEAGGCELGVRSDGGIYWTSRSSGLSHPSEHEGSFSSVPDFKENSHRETTLLISFTVSQLCCVRRCLPWICPSSRSLFKRPFLPETKQVCGVVVFSNHLFAAKTTRPQSNPLACHFLLL